MSNIKQSGDVARSSDVRVSETDVRITDIEGFVPEEATATTADSPWSQEGAAVSLADEETQSVTATLADAAAGAGDFGVAPGAGDGGRAGELRVTRNIAVKTPAGADVVRAAYAAPAYYGGIYLEDGAIAGSAALAFADVAGPWTGILGSRGDVVADSGNARVRLGATGGLWLCSYAVTFSTDIDASVTFAVNYGAGTTYRGRQRASTTAAVVAQIAGETVFDDGAVGAGQQIELAFVAGGDPAPVVTVIHASLIARRIA